MNMKPLLLKIILFLLLLEFVFSQGSLLLIGGGSENYNDWSDKPYKWFVENAQNRKILILHYETTSTWFSGYLPSLNNCTVNNLAISSISQANDSSTYKFILEHDGIFLRGGDQLQYYNKWKGTLTQKAIKDVFLRGGVIAGTSAGEMVLSEVAYLSGNTDTGAILRTPYANINLVDDFFNLVPSILAESHSNERGRLGRLPVFLAKYKNEKNREITGIAVDVNTAFAIDKNGLAEVMGANAVSIFRWDSATEFSIDNAKSFSMKNMNYDQLLSGYKFDFNTNTIEVSQTAEKYSPKSISSISSSIILDGSGNFNDWTSNEGSIKNYIGQLNISKDTIGIITYKNYSNDIIALKNYLINKGYHTKILSVDYTSVNDNIFNNSFINCSGFIFVENKLDSIAAYFNNSGLLGKNLDYKINNLVPFLFLSDDVMLAGERVIVNLYSSKYHAYYGTLEEANGLNLIKGIQFISRFYQNNNNTRSYDYSENRIMGMFWLINKYQLPWGMIIDAGTYLKFEKNYFQIEGISQANTPLIFIDGSNAKFVELSKFKRPGKQSTVQYSSLIGARINFLRPGENNIITSIKNETRTKKNVLFVEQNYPNPFNASTNINFEIAEKSQIKIKIYNSLGQLIKIYEDKEYDKGKHQIQWKAANYSSGIYYFKFEQITPREINKKTIKVAYLK